VIHLSCRGCGAWTVVDCNCRRRPDGEPEHRDERGGPAHEPGCPVGDVLRAVKCAPDSGCCMEDHDHAAVCNACPGGHEGPCLDPPGCRVHAGSGGQGDCPGGHCGPGVPGCEVCKAVTVTMMAAGPGEPPPVALQMAEG
jgi:hypothetical protein